MDTIESLTNDNHVFNNQPSISNSSTTDSISNEIIIAVWLRTDSTTENINQTLIESKIENRADQLKKYCDLPEECEKYIRCMSKKSIKIFLILSYKYAYKILENVHDLSVVHSVYIHGTVTRKEEFNGYLKIVKINTNLMQLTDDLCTDVNKYIRQAQLPITIFKQRDEHHQSTNLLNKFAYFIDFWNPLFIDLLFDLPEMDYNKEKAEFIRQCQIYYRANTVTLQTIDEFAQTYRSESAILWYQRNTFLFRLFNKVMRQQNIEGILQFRFFIFDLYNALNKIHNELIATRAYEDDGYDIAYRGQRMFIEEVEKLKENSKCGKFVISINSFFSASRTDSKAIEFTGINESNKDIDEYSRYMKPVLFEIKFKIDDKIPLKRKPFADISNLWGGIYLHEQEVLFITNSFFQIDEFIENGKIEIEVAGAKVKKTITIIKLTFLNEDDLNIPIMKDYQILKSTKTLEGKLIRIGNLLIDQSLSIGGQSSTVESYYKAFSNESRFCLTPACLAGQAWIALKKEQYHLAFELSHKALSIVDQSNVELKITILNCLGGIHSKLKEYHIALDYYKKAYDLSKPTDDMIENNKYFGPCIPIDKYAMYDNYRNISSINIARIYQIKGNTRLAWNMYKEAIDCEMRDTTDFHCHTCMTIAEAGTHEANTDPQEKLRIWKDWKDFLDLGLNDILKYRTPAVIGYLSFNHQYDFSSRRYNNAHCRTMAINYFQTVERYCLPYAMNHDYYLYTLQCYERLAQLYRDSNTRSIEYYEKMIDLCRKYHSDDLENIIIAYEGMINMYQRQQSKVLDNSDDILSKVCIDSNNDVVESMRIPETPPVILLTPPITPLKPLTFGVLFQNIKHLHFAFEFYDKWIDSRFINESDLRKKIIYCYLKLAPLYYDQHNINNAKNCLATASLLCQQFGSDMSDVRSICNENSSFINMNFDDIIQSYKHRLLIITNKTGYCMEEDNYSYIAHLYMKKNDFNLAFEFLKKPIELFEQHNYICSHTINCYQKLAEYYQTIKNDQQATIHVYERGINHVIKHRSYPMTDMISIIERCLINYYMKINDFNTIISIYKILCEITQHETIKIITLYKYLRKILKLTVDKSNITLDTYENFLKLILEIIHPLTSQMTMVLSHFRDVFINRFKFYNYTYLAIEIYQKLITLLFKYQNDRNRIIGEYKTIASNFKTNHLLQDSVNAYENLLNFVCHHPTAESYFAEDDLIRFIFYIWKYEIIKEYLKENNFNEAINLYLKMIQFLERYRSTIDVKFKLDYFIEIIIDNYDKITEIYQFKSINLDQMMNIYEKQIQFLTKYQIAYVQDCIDKIIEKCQQFAEKHQEQAIELYLKLVNFIEKNRLDYLFHLSIAYEEFIQLNRSNNSNQLHQNFIQDITNTKLNRCVDLQQRVIQYKEKCFDYLRDNKFNKAVDVYKIELLPFLLENHARDDEQVATCYKQIALLYYQTNKTDARKALDYYQKVIDIYETQKDSFYTADAFELNLNVCRRFAGTLYMCYDMMKTVYVFLNEQSLSSMYEQKAMNICRIYKDQFQFIENPTTNRITVNIRPFIELGY